MAIKGFRRVDRLRAKPKYDHTKIEEQYGLANGKIIVKIGGHFYHGDGTPLPKTLKECVAQGIVLPDRVRDSYIAKSKIVQEATQVIQEVSKPLDRVHEEISIGDILDDALGVTKSGPKGIRIVNSKK